MNTILMIIMFILGGALGCVFMGIFASRGRQEDIAEAFENGKAYERMRITKTLDDQQK